MKRFSAFLLCIVMVFGLLVVGCGTNKPAQSAQGDAAADIKAIKDHYYT